MNMIIGTIIFKIIFYQGIEINTIQVGDDITYNINQGNTDRDIHLKTVTASTDIYVMNYNSNSMMETIEGYG